MIAIVVVALVCTLGLAWGMRSFMVGWSLICWAIYEPFLTAAGSVENTLVAILAGTGIVILLNVSGNWIWREKDPGGKSVDEPEPSSPAIPFDQVAAYAITVALILGFTTYYGWIELKTDPTLMVGGAFFILGFDPQKTLLAGIARVLALIAGVAVGLALWELLGPGLVSNIVMIVACGLSFAAFAVHPGGWMFFFMIFIAMGWPKLETAAYELTIAERFYGEIAGIITAMIGIAFLAWWQRVWAR